MQFIILFVVFVVFIAFNLGDEYKCKINFGFTQTEEVPVYVTVFFSLIIGMFCILPFVFIKPYKKQNTVARKGFFQKKHGTDHDAQSEDSAISNNNYGID